MRRPRPQIHTEAGHAFQDDMRKLWEDHVTWTRLAIVSFVDELADLEATVDRLMQNQSDIGDAIKPFYGDEAGEQLTTLLEDHINGAVELMAAAKAGDRKPMKKAMQPGMATATRSPTSSARRTPTTGRERRCAR